MFSGRKTLPEEEMRSSMITGGSVSLAAKLSRDYAWNGISLLAAPIAVMEAGAVVDMHWTVLGALKDLVFSADKLWVGGSKDLKISVKMADLSMFTFPGSCNLSHWLDETELAITYSTTPPAAGEEPPAVNVISANEARRDMGAGEFSLRCLVSPRDIKGAGVWVAATPYSKAQLQQQLGANSSNHLTPHITLQIHETMPYPNTKAGRAAHALFSRQEQIGDGYGFGVLPWLDITAEGEEDAICPDPDTLKEAVLRFMRSSTTTATATTGIQDI